MDPSREQQQATPNPVVNPGNNPVAAGGPTSAPTPQIAPGQNVEGHTGPRPNSPAVYQQPQASSSETRQAESQSSSEHQQEPSTSATVHHPESIAIRQPEVTVVHPPGSSTSQRRVRSATNSRYNGQETRPSILINSPVGLSGSPERLHAADTDMHSDGSHPLPPLPPHGIRSTRLENGERLPNMNRNSQPSRRGSGVDWIVPEKHIEENTVGDRLRPTLEVAKVERDKYALKAKMTGYALNIAIGLQVLLGALTTGLSAATSGHSTSVSISILGGLSTLVASYLARARGSNEPELSITRVKDLEQFIRECEAFIMDQGHNVGTAFDDRLHNLRRRFEELLGNADGQRRLAPPV